MANIKFKILMLTIKSVLFILFIMKQTFFNKFKRLEENSNNYLSTMYSKLNINFKCTN